MKRIFSLLLLIICFSYSSNKEIITEREDTIEADEYFVNIGFFGEILIDRTSNNNIDINDVYGIQVYSKNSAPDQRHRSLDSIPPN